MKRLSPALPLLLAAFFCAAPPLPADAAPPTAKRHESRFLFIVDTSAAMRGCSNASVQGVIDLLASDMKGELRKGDTIGLWTYNEQLSTEYPMQVWSTEDKSAIMDEMAAYLRGRRYGKRAHLENVMPALGQVIKNSERLAVILISDGSGLIQGTPYDREINLLQKKYARDLRSAHQPFVTVLAVRDGVVFDYIINYPGWVAIPHIPTPPPPKQMRPFWRRFRVLPRTLLRCDGQCALSSCRPAPMRLMPPRLRRSQRRRSRLQPSLQRPFLFLRLWLQRLCLLLHTRLLRLFPYRRMSPLLRPLRQVSRRPRPSWRGRTRNRPPLLPRLMRRRL